MLDFPVENLSAEDVERLRRIYEPLTNSVRELIDATIRTEVDGDAVAAAKAEIDSATARLRSRQLDGSFGVRFGADGDQMPWGNVVIGMRNPVAPPLVFAPTADGGVRADFHLGAASRGRPGTSTAGSPRSSSTTPSVRAASAPDKPRLTGTITMRYRRMTALGDLHVEAAVVRTEGVKTFAEGRLCDAEGVTVEAEGVFIRPRWARD